VRQEEKTSCDKAVQLNESDFQENLDSLEKDEDADKKDKPSDCESRVFLFHRVFLLLLQ